MKKAKITLYFILSTSILFISSCGKDDNPTPETTETVQNPPPPTNYYVQDSLDNGATILDILAYAPVSSLYGATYQGGLIFYVNTSNGTGMVAAPSDQSSGAFFGCPGDDFGVYNQSIGSGSQNTIDLVGFCNNNGTPYKICNDLVLGGYSDWYLPSKDELNAMYVNLQLNGYGNFFQGYYYWSSSEVSGASNGGAWAQAFNTGNQNACTKNAFGNNLTRAVRSF